MAGVRSKSLHDPDESFGFPGMSVDLVELDDLVVGRTVQQPGWRWSTHVRPTVGGEWCQARHIGIVLSGRWGVDMADGSSVEFGPDDAYDVPPGHDGYTIGDDPVVAIEWSGLRTLARAHVSFQGRVLATLMFCDLVESTRRASELGDVTWRDLLSRLFHRIRGELERCDGREVKTTGDGMLAIFDGPAVALRCADRIRACAEREGLDVRIGVTVGEVEFVGDDVRGLAVHEAARIMAEAQPGEILVSETTRALSAPSGMGFADRGTRELKGLPGPRALFAYTD